MSRLAAATVADEGRARSPRPRLYALLIAASGASALLGFAREATVGALFGASRATDAFYVALALPFIAAYFLVGGALAPPLTAAVARRLELGDAGGARDTFGASLRLVAVAGLLACAALAAASEPIARLLAPGFDAGAHALLARLLRLLLPYGLLTSVALLSSAALTAAGAYKTPVVSALLGNVAALVVLLALAPRFSIEAAAFALDAGALVSLAALVPRLASAGLFPRGLGTPTPLPWRDASLLALSLAAAGAVDLAERPFASTVGVGSVAILAFASKLVHVPMRLVAAPLTSVSFPRFVRSLRLKAEGSREAGETAAWIVRLLAFSAATTAGAAAPLAALTFGRGRFDAHALELLGRALLLLAPAVVAIGFIEVAAKYLLAAGRARAVLAAQVAGLAAYLVAAPLLTRLGVPGLAFARDLSWGAVALGLAVPLVVKEHVVSARELAVSALGALVAAPAAAMAARLVTVGAAARIAAAAVAAGGAFAAVLAIASRGRGRP